MPITHLRSGINKKRKLFEIQNALVDLESAWQYYLVVGPVVVLAIVAADVSRDVLFVGAGDSVRVRIVALRRRAAEPALAALLEVVVGDEEVVRVSALARLRRNQQEHVARQVHVLVVVPCHLFF